MEGKLSNDKLTRIWW